MKRLLLIYNPNSSKYIHVKKDIFSRISDIKGCIVGKFAIQKIGFEKNVSRLTEVLRDGDFVLSAGGDATAAIAANAILDSGKDVTLAVLPYGNFNDLARTLGTMKYEDIFGQVDFVWTGDAFAGGRKLAGPTQMKVKKLYPLDIVVDGEHWRYATCYVTIGMTAEAVELFDEEKVRKDLQKGHKSSWRSYLYLAKWYFKNRHKKRFIPEFKLNGKLEHRKISDYAAVNGRSMCRVMKGGDDYKKPQIFRSEVERTTSFPRLFMLMAKSILHRVPGDETKGDIIEFLKPSTVELQAEGEYRVFENVSKIKITKATRSLKVIEKGNVWK